MSDSNEQYSVIDYNSFGSVLRPFTRNIYDASGNISGVFEQTVDTCKVIDFKKILKKELEENQIELLENLDKQASVMAVHAEEQKKYDPVIIPDNNPDSGIPEMTTEEKEELLTEIKAAKLLGKIHTTLDKQEVDAVTEHIGEEIDETNKKFDINKDGKIDQKDVEYVRIAIRYQYEKAGVLIDNSNLSVKIEDMVKFTIKPTSGQSVVSFNGQESSGKAIVVPVGTTVDWQIVSCGKYTESGSYMVMDKETLTVLIKEEVTSATYGSAINRTYGGDILVTENIFAGACGQAISANGTFILDMNNYSYTSTDSSRSGYFIRGNSNFTIKNAGTMTGPSTSKPLVWANSASCTINLVDGEYISADESGECIYCYSGTINISGGTYKSTAVDGYNKYLLNCYDSNYKNGTAKIIVTGGKFYGFDPANSNDGSYVAEGYISTEKTDEQGNTYFEVTAE